MPGAQVGGRKVDVLVVEIGKRIDLNPRQPGGQDGGGGMVLDFAARTDDATSRAADEASGRKLCMQSGQGGGTIRIGLRTDEDHNQVEGFVRGELVVDVLGNAFGLGLKRDGGDELHPVHPPATLILSSLHAEGRPLWAWELPAAAERAEARTELARGSASMVSRSSQAAERIHLTHEGCGNA